MNLPFLGYRKLNNFMRRTFQTIFLFLSLFYHCESFSQIIPADRLVDWKIAGLNDTTTLDFEWIDLSQFGMDTNGILPCDVVIDSLLALAYPTGVILQFPAGTFLFNDPKQIPSNCVIRGQGANSTTLKMDLGGTGHGFNIQGSQSAIDTSYLMINALKDSNNIEVFNAASFSVGDWIRIGQEDADLVTSAWAIGSVGQIARIVTISGNSIHLASPLRMAYALNRQPFIKKLSMKRNVGIECLSIIRLDNTAPEQAANISFRFAENCWVNGIASTNCTFGHLVAESSSNLQIEKSYFHDAFEYGGNGRGYGVVLQFTSNECRVENNIFEHLRHSMLLQAGSNGNVFAFNHSFDPYWVNGNPLLSGNSAGEIVLHGNYVFANLFEQNSVQNIVIDNSHGANGPDNTFFRNRASLYGIFFSDNTSPHQTFVGNEIPNTSFPYSAVNYSIQGIDHFVFGNNNKGTIAPAGTSNLLDSTYSYSAKPNYVQGYQWAKIGPPSQMNSASIPSKDRLDANDLFAGACGNNDFYLSIEKPVTQEIMIYPNPSQGNITIEIQAASLNELLRIYNVYGQLIQTSSLNYLKTTIDLTSLNTGVYFVLIKDKSHKIIIH
jgi:hypothetical protein